jgi:DNA-binding SARP family transcriptional activator
MSGSFIVRTKLIPPPLNRHILHRPALAKKMKGLYDIPLMIVHSGPGYGKSTALAAFLHTEKTPFGWYSIGKTERDLLPFLMYTAHALVAAHPQLGEGWLDDLARIGERFPREDAVQPALATFVNTLSALNRDVVLVLDDYHHVRDSEPVGKWMEALLAHQPGKLHLVVSGRSRPDWEILTVLKARGQLLEITEKELAFQEEEIAVLFHDSYELPLTEQEVRRICRKTEGWAVAVQMIRQRLQAGGDLDAVLNSGAESMDDLFAFLAGEVLRKETPDMQFFLEQASIFEEISAAVCRDVLDLPNAEALLERASGQKLFLFEVGEGRYRFHALFREFLQQELRKKSGLFEHLHRKAARYYQAVQRNDLALHHGLAAGDHESLAETAALCGRSMIANGQLESLFKALSAIPEPLKDRRPTLWICEGEILRYRCVYEKALACYRRGEEQARKAGDAALTLEALEGQAKIYLDTIQPGRADGILRRALALLEEEQAANEQRKLRLVSMMAENLVNAGRAAEAEVWYAGRSALAPEENPVNLEARLHLRTGRLREAQRILERRKAAGEAHPGFRLPQAHRETDLLLSLIASLFGEPERARRLGEAALVQGIRSKAPFVEACARMRMGHAAQLAHKDERAVALDCYTAAIRMMDEIGAPRGKAEPLMGLCLLYGRAGVRDMAMMYGEQALTLTEQADDFWLSSLIRLSMGVSAACCGAWREASALLEECRGRFVACGDGYSLTVTLLWQSYVSYYGEDGRRFDEHMEQFLKMLQAGEYEFLLHRRTLFGPRDVRRLAPLLFEAQDRNIRSRYVRYLLETMGLSHAHYHPGYTLRIQTLGAFRVWLGDRELKDKDWQRGKARELFQLLITKRRRLLPKEEILELLWPEQDRNAAARDFKVALNALNTALEPHRRARSGTFFIQRHGSSYGLNLASGFELDAVEFEALTKQGLEEKDPEKAAQVLEAGLALYEGDYLPDRRYDDWCLEERERLRVLFLRGAEKLAGKLAHNGEYDKAIHWCERIVGVDACWEEAYRLLMVCHIRKHNRREAIRWYRICKERLARELGIAPMPQLTRLYEAALREDAALGHAPDAAPGHAPDAAPGHVPDQAGRGSVQV